MFHRGVCLLMIFGIIACPMWCASGVMGCCATTPSLQPEVPCKQQTCCCKEKSSDTGQKKLPNDSPLPPNPQDSCQGVCGGAVVEKSCELSNSLNVVLLLPIPTDDLIPTGHPECRGQNNLPVDSQSGNVGQKLRALHMSFLC